MNTPAPPTPSIIAPWTVAPAEAPPTVEEGSFAAVVVPAKPERIFHYRVPSALAGSVQPGMRVRVPFGPRSLDGYVVQLLDRSDVETVKPLTAVLDAEPILGPSILALTRWMAEYYLAPWGKVLAAAVPAGLKVGAEKRVILTDAGRAVDEAGVRGAVQRRILAALRSHPGPITLARLAKRAGSIAGLPALLDRGWVTEAPTAPGPTPRLRPYVSLVDAGLLPSGTGPRGPLQRAVLEALAVRHGAFVSDLGLGAGAACRALASRGVVTMSLREPACDPYGRVSESTPAPVLTADQGSAVSTLVDALSRRRFAPYLLWGVTGSGKTEVYLQAMASALAMGRGCLLLVPEIGLTGQIVQQVRARFGDEVAVLHSGLSSRERFAAWTRIRRGQAHVALGTRSALWAPLPNVGLIVVDEEQDASYKQEDGVRYHARDSAVVLGSQAGAVVVLGSATPSLESYANAVAGRYGLLRLPDRVESRSLPTVRLVGLGAGPDGGDVLSPELHAGIDARLVRGEQVLLLLNRRGYAPVVVCRDCGVAARCPQCSVGLTYHRERGKLCCHYCGFSIAPKDRCEGCGGHRITLRGVGTEQVEERLRAAWPSARVARMDRDTTQSRLAHDGLLDAMRRGDTDILVGTQMIAKGHDLPNVTLVGIINADVGLSLPDFRATERVFQLLAQAAGRSGRGERPGEVIVQTRRPTHEAFLFAQRHDVAGFYEQELLRRRELGYPPYGRLAIVLMTGIDERRVIDAAAAAASAGAELAADGVSLLGPAPAPLWRLKGRHRWQLILKGPRGPAVRDAAHSLVTTLRAGRLPRGVTVDLNVDPHHVL
ncbi:MAG: primosomal protein N' [Nitrospiria bacterium]